MADLAHWQRQRERQKRWHHGIQRYVTVGRKRDHLRAVWDVTKAHRVSRWVRPERAEHACTEAEESWRRGRGVVLWIEKMAPVGGDET